MEKFHSFLAYTVVTIGLVKGRTVLPLPPSDVTSSEKTSSKDKSLILESAIVQWSKQIKHVLKQDPENALKNGNNPSPMEELNFWKNKSDNLNSICQQLSSERIKKVLKFLEQSVERTQVHSDPQTEYTRAHRERSGCMFSPNPDPSDFASHHRWSKLLRKQRLLKQKCMRRQLSKHELLCRSDFVPRRGQGPGN